MKNLTSNKEYRTWLTDLKLKVRTAQIKAALAVNAELLAFYWELGAGIVARQKSSGWGTGLIDQLSQDLSREFPDMKGFLLSNLKYVRQWYVFYNQETVNSQQVVGQITQIPLGHNIAIITACKTPGGPGMESI